LPVLQKPVLAGSGFADITAEALYRTTAYGAVPITLLELKHLA
jgi:hypothetical protein